MSAAHRQHTCACCGKELRENDEVEVELLTYEAGWPMRAIAVLTGHHTYTWKKHEDPT